MIAPVMKPKITPAVILAAFSLGWLAMTSPLCAASLTQASFSVTPLIAKADGGERSIVAAAIESDGLKNVKIALQCPAWSEPARAAFAEVAAGKQQLEIRTPVLTQAARATATLEWEGGSRTLENIDLKATRRWTVYLTQHTHTDIGYTRPQTEILPEHLRYIDFALDYCDLTDGYPADAQFRWTCETAWATREYLKRRPAAQIERLKKRVQEGRVELAGMLLNMAEIANESNLAALMQQVHMFREQFGVSVVTAMQNDVNGAGWCLPDYFSGMGIKYLTMGINQTRSLLPFDKPTAFWWESPSGKRTLAYRADHYMTANFWHIEQGKLETVKPEVVKYLQSLEDRSYPFDRVGVQFSGYFTDNSPPSTAACDVVKNWNEQFASPRLRLSTAHEFLEYVEKEKGSTLPVHRQAWPDWWTDGFGSAARETAACLDTQASLQTSQGLLSMAALLGTPIPPAAMERVANIQDDLLFYAEHTYGAAESIDDPMAENSLVQWGEKGSYVWSAVKNANLLREEAFGLVQEYLPRAKHASMAVFNTLNWERSGLVQVFIDHQILPKDAAYRIVDGATGREVPAQPMKSRAEGTYWALWVNQVPSLGFKTLTIEPREGARAADPVLEIKDQVLENEFYKLTLDPEKGVKSLIEKSSGAELVDAQSPWLLGQCVYETMKGKRDKMSPEVYQRAAWKNLKIEPGANGRVWRSAVIHADMEGCATNHGLALEIRLYNTAKRIEFHYNIRKEPLTQPEAVYVAFPFNAPSFSVAYEAQGGMVVPGEQQIPGSASDWQTVQNFVAIRHPKGQILWGSPEVPLVQLGDFNLGKWQRITKVEKPHVYSWVMNNYWFTNFRATQEGEFKWSYYLTSTADKDNTAATRFGWGSRVPLVARVLPHDPRAQSDGRAATTTLAASVPNILCVEARPASDGRSLIVQLREVDGKAVEVTPQEVQSCRPLKGADEVNVLGETLRENTESVSFEPYEVKFVRVKLD
jgi:hypothetical protein